MKKKKNGQNGCREGREIDLDRSTTFSLDPHFSNAIIMSFSHCAPCSSCSSNVFLQAIFVMIFIRTQGVKYYICPRVGATVTTHIMPSYKYQGNLPRISIELKQFSIPEQLISV